MTKVPGYFYEGWRVYNDDKSDAVHLENYGREDIFIPYGDILPIIDMLSSIINDITQRGVHSTEDEDI